MIDLGNRVIHEDGTVIISEDAGIELLYSGGNLDDAIFRPSDDVDMYNRSVTRLDMRLQQLLQHDQAIYDGIDWYGSWLTPEPYASMDILLHCLDKCDSEAGRTRVEYEMRLFEQRGMIPVLRHICYMVDTLRDNKIVWGVGRGSSVSSYVLHLLGINRINPLEFDLDIGEFLK